MGINLIMQLGKKNCAITLRQRQKPPWGDAALVRLVVIDFFEKYERILLRSDLKISILKVYVDDGRQVTSKLKKGMRYSETEERFTWNRESEKEDEELERAGEKEDEFMARLCLEAMNKVNPDLTFTAEVASDFADNRLPTIDFTLWMKENGKISHTYYEKEMKTQKVIEKNSAMSKKQQYCILANETTRRLYNIDMETEKRGRRNQKSVGKYDKTT